MSKPSPKNRKPLAIGLTGGIGAGKSTVARIFATLGIPIFSADLVAKHLMELDGGLQSAIASLLGDGAIAEGRLNRAFTAKQVFGNDELRLKLNALIHPKVREAFEQFLVEHSGAPYVLQEAAILFETGGYKLMDFNILVTAPVELRLQRVTQRDGSTAADVSRRMAAQWTDEQKLSLADRAIINDGQQALLPQVLAVAKFLGGR